MARLLKIAAGIALVAVCTPANAGMPSPELVVTELAQRRLEELSFFVAGFLGLTAFVRWLWNGLQRDWPGWPKLSYRSALSLMLLWGLLLVVVLSLVSGARELMTPAAWEANGVTFRLRRAIPAAVVDTEYGPRLKRLEDLRFVLWKFAAEHDGRFPTSEEYRQLDPEVWMFDAPAGLSYRYTPGLSIRDAGQILVYEPDVSGDGQLVVRADGSIGKLTSIAGAVASGAAP